MASAKPKILSQEFIDDSDDDMPEVSTKQSTPASLKSKADASQAESSDPSECESQSKADKESSIDEDEASDKDEMEINASQENHTAKSALSRSGSSQIQASTAIADTYSSTSDVRPAPPFVPPANFYTIDKINQRTLVSTNFSKIALSGKQLWHISVPAGTPMDKVREISWDKVTKGEAIFEHNSESYGVTVDGDERGTQSRLMVPEADGYHIVPTKLSRVLQIRQVIGIPDLAKLQKQVVERLPLKKDHVQPKGLRMRYKTSGAEAGYDGGALGDSESDAPEPPAKRIRTNGTTPAPKKESSKRKREGDTSREKSSKKSRKPSSKESPEVASDRDEMDVEPTNKEPSRDNREKKHKEKERHRSEKKHKEKERHKERDKHKEKHKSKDKHRSKEKDKSKDEHKHKKSSKKLL